MLSTVSRPLDVPLRGHHFLHFCGKNGGLFYGAHLKKGTTFDLFCSTVAPLFSPAQEVSTSHNDITIEMHMHDGTEVGHFILSPMYCPTSVPSCICISIVMSLGEVLTSWTGKVSGATVKRILNNFRHTHVLRKLG